MLSKLVVGKDQGSQVQKVAEILGSIDLKLDSPDVLGFEREEKVGVEETKKVREFLSIKPIGMNKAVVFWNSSLISNLAQNALLKTIEDISENGVVILVGHQKDDVIPTLLSRLEVVRLTNEAAELVDLEKVRGWVEASLAERFKIIEGLDDKSEFLELLGILAEENIGGGQKWLNLGNQILEAEKFWKANGNQRAILEWLALELESR